MFWIIDTNLYIYQRINVHTATRTKIVYAFTTILTLTARISNFLYCPNEIIRALNNQAYLLHVPNLRHQYFEEHADEVMFYNELNKNRNPLEKIFV